MIHTRRKFLTGLGSLLAAPAIVHAGNLMPVKALHFDVEGKIFPFDPPLDPQTLEFLEGLSQRIVYQLYYGNPNESPTQFTGLFIGNTLCKFQERMS